MQEKYFRFSRTGRRNGVTLVEVIAAITLMGSLLTVTIVASSKFSRQMRHADEKRIATRQLDAFLSTWSVGEFSAESIGRAVERSGMPAIGYFGTHRLDRDMQSMGPTYGVRIDRNGEAGLAQASLFRLSVYRTDSRSDVPVAWAEVIATP